jgi:DNA-binding transcriptional ArsR family regulator
MRPKRRLLAFVSLFDLGGAVDCEIRVELLLRLAGGAVAVDTLASLCRHTHSYVSRQLGELATADLVTYSQDGRHTLYRLSKRVHVAVGADGVPLTVRGDDGSSVTYVVPSTMAERMGVRIEPPPPPSALVLPPVIEVLRGPIATRIERDRGTNS